MNPCCETVMEKLSGKVIEQLEHFLLYFYVSINFKPKHLQLLNAVLVMFLQENGRGNKKEAEHFANDVMILESINQG